jgi:hypothetical protein
VCPSAPAGGRPADGLLSYITIDPFSSCTTVRFDVVQDKAGVHDCGG